MTPKQILSAYKAISELTGCVLPYKVSRSIHKLATRLEEEYKTILKTEQNMAAQYDGVATSNGYEFKDSDIAKQFYIQYNEFMAQEDDIELPNIDLSEYTDILKISAIAIEALKDIVYFGED